MNTPINVRNFVVAPLLNETKKGNSYGQLKELAPAMQCSFSPETSQQVLYGNGIKQAVAVKVGEETISLGINYVSLEDLALLCGHTYVKDDGTGREKLIKSDADKAPYLGVGATIDGEDGSSRSVWYNKVKFQAIGEEVEQSEDNVNFSTPTVEGSAVATADGNVSYRVDYIPESTKVCPDYIELHDLQAIPMDVEEEKELNATATIEEITEGDTYTVTFNYAYDLLDIDIIVKKDGSDVSKNTDIVTITGNGIKRTVKIAKGADTGLYQIIAQYKGQELATKEFTVAGVRASISEVSKKKEYNVVFSVFGVDFEDTKAKVEVTKNGENYSTATIGDTGKTRNVKLGDYPDEGQYKIIAKYDDKELATEEFSVEVTGEIQQVEENKEYNVVFSDNADPSKIEVKVDQDGTDVSAQAGTVTIGKEGTTRNVKLTDTAKAGTYTITASYDGSQKDTQEFEVVVTAEISEDTEGEQYTVTYSKNAEESKIAITVMQDDSTDISSESTKVTIGESGTTRQVTFTNEQLDTGKYTIHAKYDNEDLDTFDYTKSV